MKILFSFRTLSPLPTHPGNKYVARGPRCDYGKGATVLQKCYSNDITEVALKDHTNDGWQGSLSYSNDGGTAYSWMTCNSNCGGTSTSSELLTLDGNADGAGLQPTECLNGNSCTFVKAALWHVQIFRHPTAQRTKRQVQPVTCNLRSLDNDSASCMLPPKMVSYIVR